MMFDMKSARDGNTVSCWKESIWRVFLDGKLFISDDHQTCFDTRGEALDAMVKSTWMKSVNKYVDYSQKFFDKEGDVEWREDFMKKIFEHLNIEFKEYTCNGESSGKDAE